MPENTDDQALETHDPATCSAISTTDLGESVRRSLDKLRKRKAFCWYCGLKFETAFDGFASLLDPRPLGQAIPKNTVRGCRECVDKKANKTLEEYRVLLENAVFYGESSGHCPIDPVIPCSVCLETPRFTVHIQPTHGVCCEIFTFPREIMSRSTVKLHEEHRDPCGSRFEITVSDE